MNTMLFTVMPMFVCLFWGILLALALINDGEGVGSRRSMSSYRRPRLHLLVFMTASTLLYLGHYIFFSRNTPLIPVTDTIYCICNLSVYPLYYIYIRTLTLRQSNQGQWIVMLAPAVLGGIATGLLYLMMSAEETSQFIESYLYEGQRFGLTGLVGWQAYIHDTCKLFFALLIIPVFVYGRRHINSYNKLIEEVYADTENKSLVSLHYMLTAFIITSIVSFVMNIVGRQYFTDSSWALVLSSLSFSVLLFSIGYIGFYQQFSIADIEQDELQADASNEDLQNMSELRIRIEQLMDTEQLFLSPNLKILDLVQRLNTNRNYIYLAINREMGVSFSEYVNRKRIDYAKQVIEKHPEMALTEVASKSGFSSSTSFYRNFRLFTGIGPKDYQDNQRNDKQ